MDKRAFYQREDVVSHYDSWRFGSPGGRYVDSQETETVLSLLDSFPRNGALLDLPCGTGRLLRALQAGGFTCLHGADASPAMLARSRQGLNEIPLTETDAFGTVFPANSFDGVCSLRFLFHVPEASKFLQEIHRILRPGGWFVFDSIRWTPRGLFPPVDRRLGGRLFCHGERQLVLMLKAHGFTVIRIQRRFLLPSLLYRFLPTPLAHCLGWIEGWVPRSTFTKSFILAQKMD